MAQNPYGKKRVAILHPDLGIGGAETLIINIALALERTGHEVTVFTPFYDRNRCLKESLSLNVQVRGNLFPRTIFGRMIAMCAYIRMLLCALYVVMFAGHYDFYMIDQVSFPIPILRCRSRKVVYYCHHPDKLLCTNRTSLVMRLYRYFLDFVEEITTGMANLTLVNSEYTRNVYKANFPMIQRYRVFSQNANPDILYPNIDLNTFKMQGTIEGLLPQNVTAKTVVVTSLNRYERKKDIPLALNACAKLKKIAGDIDFCLVVAGGYDERVIENVEHHLELVTLAKKLDLRVVFLRSISNEQRIGLLRRSKILLYTPQNEHFGIVPLEACYLGCTVIACNSGGPLESIVHGKTGYLMPPDSSFWAEQIANVITGKDKETGTAGKQRVIDHFSEQAFQDRLVELINQLEPKNANTGVRLHQE